MAKELTIDTNKMVREIRDRMRAETEGMTREQRREYIRRKAAEAEQVMGIPAASRNGRERPAR